MKSTKTLRLFVSSLLLLAVKLAAQSVDPITGTKNPPPTTGPVVLAPAPTKPARTDEVVELSPFNVTAKDDEGYRAANTLAGSRLNSSLRDTPGVLDVLTPEFLSDIGATTLEQALNFSTNFAEDAGDFDSQGVINTIFPGSQINVNFRNRGLSGTIARNYLQTDSKPAFYTVERIDNSSGPNAILFGLGSAGGVANITTKRGKLNRDAYGLDFMIDGNNSRRTTIDINQVLIPKTLALRVNAIHEITKKNRANFSNNTDGIQLATTWRASDKTEVRVEYELEHTTGSVAYPGPHLISAYLTNWLDRGSPVITLPANWETLSTAARDAIANPAGAPKNFIYYTSTSPVVVQSGGKAYVFNAVSSLFTNPAQGSNGATSFQSIDPRFYNPRGNINGPGGRKGVDRQILNFAIDHKFTEKLYLNISGSKENSSADTYQAYANGAASGAVILADANATLTNGSQAQVLSGSALTTNAAGLVVNPFAGQFYTQSRWLHRTQENNRKIIQGTVAYQFDLGRWFGNHRMVATSAYMENDAGSENFRDSWLYAPFNADPVNTNNGVFRRTYASPLDAGNFHVPDWRDLPVVTWNSPTKGPLTSGWVTEGENFRSARQISYLVATQSRFFNNRLVLTAGYRVDDATDYVFGQTTVKPPGWEASNGLKILDPANVTKTNTQGPTRTLGAVYHATHWMSVYANKSTNFGPPRGNVVGPDAETPPNTAGKGLDAGLKLELLDNKFFLDLGYFETTNNNVTEVLTINLNTIDSIRGTYNAVFPILNNPIGSAPLFNSNDPAAVAALIAAYPLTRPVYSANADMLDQASSGYEARLTANPIRGLRLRATFSKTARNRESLYKFTLPMAAQLRTYIKDLQAKNPGVNVGGLTSTANPGLTVNTLLDNLDSFLDQAVDSLGNNFGAGKYSGNFTASYDFQNRLKGWGGTVSTQYKSGAYTGAYEVRTGGVSTGILQETVPVFGNSTISYDTSIRYRTRLDWLKKTALTLQLNVFNVLDKSDPVTRRINTIVIAPGGTPPSRQSYVPSSYFIRDPRRWLLTAKIDF
ncbi:MAG: hypothetical protein ABIY47_06255 [Opitutaceae bacterium]